MFFRKCWVFSIELTNLVTVWGGHRFSFSSITFPLKRTWGNETGSLSLAEYYVWGQYSVSRYLIEILF